MLGVRVRTEASMERKNKKKKWIKWRHRLVRNLLYLALTPYCRIKYGLRVERFREQEDRPYLILLNHQTPMDQFFVGMSFRGPIYYLATEDIFSNGWVSKLIRYLVAPIPIKKQTTDVKAILNCIRVVKEGGTISIAPEGNRTYSGRTEYMSPSIVPLARKLGLPIVLYRIEGGYGAQPRWSDVVRRGKMRSYVARVVHPEEYATLSDDELFAIIRDGLYVDEACSDGEYRHKKCAEYLERAVYVCPECGLSTFISHRDVVRCTRCGWEIRYLPTKELRGVEREFPFPFVAQWYDYQKKFINGLDVTVYTEEPLYREQIALSKVIPYDRKVPLCKTAELSLFGDRMEIASEEGSYCFAFDGTRAVTVLGRNKLNVYHGDTVYQIKGGKRFNALKYVHIYHRYQNIKKGEQHVEFLGL